MLNQTSDVGAGVGAASRWWENMTHVK